MYSCAWRFWSAVTVRILASAKIKQVRLPIYPPLFSMTTTQYCSCFKSKGGLAKCQCWKLHLGPPPVPFLPLASLPVTNRNWLASSSNGDVQDKTEPSSLSQSCTSSAVLVKAYCCKYDLKTPQGVALGSEKGAFLPSHCSNCSCTWINADKIYVL